MALKKRWKRFLTWLMGSAGFLLLFLGLAVISHAWWLPRAALFYLNLQTDIEVERIENEGWDAFKFYGLRFEGQGTVLNVQYLRGPLPWGWIKWKWHGGEQANLEINQWELDWVGTEAVPDSEDDAPFPNPSDVFSAIGEIHSLATRYLPPAVLENGTITFAEKEVRIQKGSWSDPEILFSNINYEYSKVDSLSLVPTDEGWSTSLVGSHLETPLKASLEIGIIGDNLNWTGSVRGLGKPLRFSARLAANSWKPAELRLQGESIRLNRLIPNQYGISNAVLSGRFVYEDDRWQVDLKGSEIESVQLPDDFVFSVDVKGNGNEKMANLKSLEIRSEKLKASLSAPVSIEFKTFNLAEPAQLNLSVVDLEWSENRPAIEELTGKIELQPLMENTNTLGGMGLNGEVTIKLADFDPEIKSSIKSSLNAESISFDAKGRSEGLFFDVAGAYDRTKSLFQNLEFNYKLDAAFPFSKFTSRIEFKQLNGSGQFSGDDKAFEIDTVAEFEGLKLAGVQPLGGTLEIEGSPDTLFQFFSAGTVGSNEYEIEGNWIKDEIGKLELEVLKFVENDNHWSGIADLTFDSGLRGLTVDLTSRTESTIKLSISELNSRPVIKGSLTAIQDSLIRQILSEFNPEFEIDNLGFNFKTNETGNIYGDWSGSGTFRWFKSGDMTRFSGSSKLLADGLVFGPSAMSAPGDTSLELGGRLPVGFFWDSESGRPGYRVLDSSAADFNLSGVLPPFIANYARENAGLVWQDSSIRINLGGMIDSLRLTALLNLDQISISGQADVPPLSIDKLSTNIIWNSEALVLEDLSLSGYGEQMELSYSMPLSITELIAGDSSNRSSLVQESFAEAKARLSLSQFNLAALSRPFPQFPLHEGLVTADLELGKDFQLQGYLNIEKGVSAPILEGTRIQDIEGRLNLDGNIAETDKFVFNFRSKPIQLSGKLDYRNWPNGLIDIKAKATGVPLVRNENLIIRSDLNLGLSGNKGRVPVISGNLTLKDSVFLQDLQGAFSSGPKSAEKRPPYFSIETNPYDAWKLNLSVQGKEFLRVDTPAFRGRISADFDLSNTLEEPVLSGELNIDNGRVIFPFGQLSVQQGIVSLQTGESFSPNLDIQANGRSFGYEINMSLTGTAREPYFEFNSSPPLQTDSILLLLSSGAIPNEDGTVGQARTAKMVSYLGKGVLGTLLNRYSGNDDFADRIEFEYGSDITESGRETFEVQFKLTDDFSLSGEYDRFDNYNANLKWTLLEKE